MSEVSMAERDEIIRHRERTVDELARVLQKWALGSDHAGVGDHYVDAAKAALAVLAPEGPDEIISWRRRVGISPPSPNPPSDSGSDHKALGEQA